MVKKIRVCLVIFSFSPFLLRLFDGWGALLLPFLLSEKKISSQSTTKETDDDFSP